MKDTGEHPSHLLEASSLCRLSWPRAVFEKPRSFSRLGISHLDQPRIACRVQRDRCPEPQDSKDEPSMELLSLSSLWHEGAGVQLVDFWGQLHPAHLEEKTPAVRSPLGKEELLQDFPQVEQEDRKDLPSSSPVVMGCCSQ